MITIKKIIKRVKSLAHKHKSAVYKTPKDSLSCQYNRGSVRRESDGEYVGQGCIFGQALRAEGVPTRKLTEVDYIGGVIERLGIKASADEINWCVAVQSEQDVGKTWGESIKAANNKVKL